MSYVSDHIIPGHKGKMFGSNLKTEEQFEVLKERLLKINGIEKISLDQSSYPFTVIIFTEDSIEIEKIQDESKKMDIHLIPKTGIFPI